MRRRFTAVLLAFSMLFISFNFAYADDKAIEFNGKLEDSVRSFQKDYFMGVMHKTVQNGRGLNDISGVKEEKRKELNYKIYQGEDVGKVSLFDRFGTGIKWPMYLGEKVVLSGPADKLYTAVIQETEGKLSFKNAIELITRDPTAYLNKYYSGRPQLKNEGNDPRVQRYNQIGSVTVLEDVSLASANFLLNLSQGMTGIANLLIGGELPSAAINLLKGFLTSPEWKPIAEILQFVVPFAVIGSIIYVMKSAYPLLIGRLSKKEFFQSLGGAFISLGMFTMLIYQPTALLDVTTKVLTFGDTILAASINEMEGDNEIVNSDSLDNVIEASIWEESVYKPWVKGIYGKDYDQLYSSSSEKPDNAKWNLAFDAEKAIGKPTVPIGAKDNKIENWGALAYSTQSIYHIDTNMKAAPPKADTKEDIHEKDRWPKARLAASNRSLFKDDFKWLDALCMVGHYEKKDGAQSESPYSETNPYVFRGNEMAIRSIILSLLLLPLAILGWKKLKCLVGAVLATLKIMFNCLANIFKPNEAQFTPLKSISVVGQDIMYYLWFCLMLFLGIVFYKKFGTSENVALVILYLGLVIGLLKITPANYKDKLAGATEFLHAKVMDAKYFANKLQYDMVKGGTVKQNAQKAALDAQKNADPTVIDYDRLIPLDAYFGATEKATTERQKRCYEALIRTIKSSKRVGDVVAAINSHRSTKANRNMDFDVLGIPHENYAADPDGSNKHNEHYDAKQKEINDRYYTDSAYGDESIALKKAQAARAATENLTKDMSKRQKKAVYRKAIRASRAYDRRTYVNNAWRAITKNSKRSVISPYTKLKIILFFLLLILAWYVLTLFLGLI